MHTRVPGLETAIEVVEELIDNFYRANPGFSNRRTSYDEGYLDALNIISSTLGREIDSLEEEDTAGTVPFGDSTPSPFIQPVQIDTSKIQTLQDIIHVFQFLDLQVYDDGSERFEPLRHLYKTSTSS